MNRENTQGLNLSPISKNSKKTFSFTLGIKAQRFLDFLGRRYATNISKYVDELLSVVADEKNIEPINYTFERGEYRECRLLLRKEVADFVEAWQNYGIIGTGNIMRGDTKPSTPIEIARKLSYLIANDSEVMQCDSAIYGAKGEWLESKFERCAEKAKQVPSCNDD